TKADPNPEQTPTGQRRWWPWLLACAGILAIALLAFAAWIQSASFQEFVRVRLISAIERTTGEKVEVRKFSFNPFRLQADADGIVLRGREGASEQPLFSAESLEVAFRLTSVWSLSADLTRIRVVKPAIY